MMLRQSGLRVSWPWQAGIGGRQPGIISRGLAPAPGWNARYDWKGFVPFDELPRSYRPADGMIVTANQRIVPDDYPHFISAEWTLPLRHDRIRFLLTRKERHDSASFAAVQADTHSAAVEDLLPVLRLARPASDLARSALGLLGQWGGDMRADVPEPLIATAWIDRRTIRVSRGRSGCRVRAGSSAPGPRPSLPDSPRSWPPHPRLHTRRRAR